MLAREREPCRAVVESRRRPRGGVMAERTVLREPNGGVVRTRGVLEIP